MRANRRSINRTSISRTLINAVVASGSVFAILIAFCLGHANASAGDSGGASAGKSGFGTASKSGIASAVPAHPEKPASPGEDKSEPVVSGDARALTYSSDIAPIVMNRCVTCHQPGGIAPFSLATYSDVKKRLSTIDDVVTAKYMPPWKPIAGYGEFTNARCMSAGEISSLKSWIKQGGPAGDLSTAPEIPDSLLQAGNTWKNGKPDIVVRLAEPYKVAADGPDVYRCFVFPLNITNTKFVTNVEFHPGNPKVLHHALFFLDNTGAARKKDEEDAELGFNSFGGPGFMPTGSLGGWAPGNSMLPLPDGVARLLRQNSDLVIQMHFHPDGKPELVQGELGIYFSKKPPKTLLLPLTLRSRKIDIPANDKSYTVTGSATVPADFDLLQVTPHAHLLCKEIKCDATTPDGKTIPLIWIKSWDFNWQEQYGFKKPIHLPEGSVVKAQWTYDNSEDNFRNPNHPPKRVTWGEQTTDEMALIFFGGTVSKNEDIPKYIRGMIFDNLLKSPELAANPGMAFKVMKGLLSPQNSPLRLLEKENESAGKVQSN